MLVSGAFVFAALAYGYFHRDQLARLASLSWGVGLAAVGARVVAYFAHNGALLLALRRFAPRLGFAELCLVSSGGFFAKQVLPGFGAIAVRMVYLKRRHDVAPGQVLGASATWVAASLATSGAFAVGAVMWLAADGRAGVRSLWVGAALVSAAGVAALVAGPRLAAAISRRVARLATFGESFAQLVGSGRVLLGVLVASLLYGAGGFASFGVIFAALAGGGAAGARSWAKAWVLGGAVQAITSIGYLVAFTPGNFGSYEWLVGAVGGSARLSLMLCLLTAALFRVAGALAALCGGALVLPLGRGGGEKPA
ncbi:MAG: flippase-like domain-containing protein [Myxococcales bacterium]|nr:flippase-like domain-containing protein [Myxococcales bacterium]